MSWAKAPGHVAEPGLRHTEPLLNQGLSYLQWGRSSPSLSERTVRRLSRLCRAPRDANGRGCRGVHV